MIPSVNATVSPFTFTDVTVGFTFSSAELPRYSAVHLPSFSAKEISISTSSPRSMGTVSFQLPAPPPAAAWARGVSAARAGTTGAGSAESASATAVNTTARAQRVRGMGVPGWGGR